jgi:TPP-dependent indolepyruvate ferredoxin oxidoreductase alpha subunit
MILSRPPCGLDQTARHVGVERIAPIRPVHGDREQALIERLQNHVVHEVVALLFVVIARSSCDEAIQTSSFRGARALARDEPGISRNNFWIPGSREERAPE